MLYILRAKEIPVMKWVMQMAKTSAVAKYKFVLNGNYDVAFSNSKNTVL
jgi:hypothetical protein